jgi:enoyl-[acyl-carrier-protein] reductase (NADH)
LYLCSDAARCVTGIVLPVDSGYSRVNQTGIRF